MHAMQEMVKEIKIRSSSSNFRRPAMLAVHEGLHLKPKPKIRIVHILSPEIIKTDAAGFRELVQRLTGKPRQKGAGGETKEKAAVRCRTSVVEGKSGDGHGGERSLEEEELWLENSGGFFGGLKDVDGFFQELSEFPPLLPLSSSQMEVLGVAHVS